MKNHIIENNNHVQCPDCGSTQVTANNQGFSAGKAIAGDILLGPIGLLAGYSGKNKIIITCLACGKQFKPGQGVYDPVKIQDAEIKKQNNRKTNKKTAKILWPIFMFFSFIMFISKSEGFGFVFSIFGVLFLAMAFTKNSNADKEVF